MAYYSVFYEIGKFGWKPCLNRYLVPANSDNISKYWLVDLFEYCQIKYKKVIGGRNIVYIIVKNDLHFYELVQ